jgi:H+/Cl- antiporter ClcA
LSALEPTNASGLSGRAYLKLVIIGATLGVPATLLASGFYKLLHWLERLLWTDLPAYLGEDAPPWYLVIGLPVCGAVLVYLARRYLPGDGGHPPLEGLSVEPTPWQHVPGVALAALGSLAFGAVLGPEAPLIALGSAVGVVIAPRLRLDATGVRLIGMAGSFAAIATLFGGPIVAGFLMLESGIGVGALLLPALLPGLAAAAMGYLLFIGVGDWGGFGAIKMSVPELPGLGETRLIDLLLAVLVGVLAAVLIKLVFSLAQFINDQVSPSTTARISRRGAVGLFLGGGFVGLISWLVSLRGIDYDVLLFSGQTALPQALSQVSAITVLLIIATKAVGYAVCLGCGFRGGLIFPSVFIGVSIATLACILFDCSPTWALVVGVGAGMTAASGLVFSSLLFAVLISGAVGIGATPAAVFAVIAAWLTRQALSEEPLLRAGE